MRLREVNEICKKCYLYLLDCMFEMDKIGKKYGNDDSNSTYINTMHEQVKKTIDSCRELREIDELSYLFQNIDEMISKNIINVKNGIHEITTICNSILPIIKVLSSMDDDDNRLGLEIKMPPTDNITDFKKYVDDLEFIFTKCPFFYSEEENLKFKSVDIGSVWLVFAITGASITAGSVLLNNIAAFIDKCYVIKSHKLTCEQQKMEIEKAKVDQKQKEEFIKVVEELYRISANNAIKELVEITKIEIKDNDDRDRVEKALDRLDKLIDKGLQIHPAIDSPKEVKALFAPIEMHYLPINDNISKIEDKSDEQ